MSEGRRTATGSRRSSRPRSPFGGGPLDQGHVTGVQRPHGRDQPDELAVGARPGEGGGEPAAGVEDLHAYRTPRGWHRRAGRARRALRATAASTSSGTQASDRTTSGTTGRCAARSPRDRRGRARRHRHRSGAARDRHRRCSRRSSGPMRHGDGEVAKSPRPAGRSGPTGPRRATSSRAARVRPKKASRSRPAVAATRST